MADGRTSLAEEAALGHRVLKALTKGRRRAIEAAQARARSNERLVVEALNYDILAGHPARGRAGRIHRRIVRQFSPNGVPGLGGELPVARISLRTVRNILARLASVADSFA